MADNDSFCRAYVDEEVPSEGVTARPQVENDAVKTGGPSPSCRIMAAALTGTTNVENSQVSGPELGLYPAGLVKQALAEAQRESRRLRCRVRIPALVIGFVLISFSWLSSRTAWTTQAAMEIFVRDLLRVLGRLSWLCACLPSDRLAPKLGCILLMVSGGRCLFWHLQSSVEYVRQLIDFFDHGQPCHIESEDANCGLGAYMIFSKALMFTVMHAWQFPYLICGIFLPSRVCLGRLWVGMALVQLTKGLSDFLTVLPSLAIRVHLGSPVESDVVLYTTLHGVVSVACGILLAQRSFRRWVYFRLLSASGAFTAASSVAAFLGSQTSRKVMEMAQDTCRFIALDKVTEKDLMSSTPNPGLKRLSTPCQLQDIDAFLSHSWQDFSARKWNVLQVWRQAFKAQHQREPRLWIDKFCIDQQNIDQSLMCLPVFLASCHTLLILAGDSYFERLWCAEEVFVYLQMNRSVTSIELLPLCRNIEDRISAFDASNAQCRDERDRQKLLATIEAGCGDYEAFNLQVQTALMHALKMSQPATMD